MGRPLAKRFFGNRNIGANGETNSVRDADGNIINQGGDDGIGGEGVASVVLNALGAYTTRPTFTFSAPQIPGGVTATGTITSEVESVTAVGGTQTGYTVGQLITVTGTDAVLRVATIGGTGGDDALTFDFTGGSRGNFTTLTTGAQPTTSNGAGTGLTVTLRFRAKSVVITQAGSGYSTAPTSTPSQSVTFTSVALTTSNTTIRAGAVGNQENAIIIRAKTTAGGTVLVGDITAQKGSNRYKVKTTDGTAVCKLVTTATPLVNQACIQATDITGNTYFVTKLTARKCVITRKSGGANYEFADPTTFPNGQIIKWTLGTAVLNSSVKVENA
jgi:hypothetical protein